MSAFPPRADIISVGQARKIFSSSPASPRDAGRHRASVGYGIYCRMVRLSTLLHLSIIAAIVSNAVYWQLGSLTSAYVVSVIAGAA